MTRNNPTHPAFTVALLTAVLGFAPLARADVLVIHTDDATLSFGAMGQLLGFGELVKDPVKSDFRAYLFMKEARVRSSGSYKGFSFNLELALGGEDTVVAPNPGITLGLLDFSLNIPLPMLGRSYIKVGQFKVPYGRERLTYSGDTQFVERSVQDLGFRVGRDVGVALTLLPGKMTVIAGVFTGGGRDVPPGHYLPEKLGVPLLVLRAGIGDVDEDSYALKQSDFTAEKPKFALFANGLYTKDTAVGHSTVLNVKEADKSVLLDSAWNPYIAQAALKPGEWWQAGVDAAVRAPVGRAQLSGEVEVNYAGYTNPYGAMHVYGGRAQAGVFFKPVELALRYSVLFPSAAFRNGTAPITGTQPIQEVTPAATVYLLGQNLKLVADLPIFFAAPVVLEPGVGSYVATELPDQVSLLSKKGTVSRQNVVEGRLMLQGRF